MAILPAPTSMPISPDLDQLPGDGSFDCHICLDLAQDPVVTLCGHLFCWPCLYRWLHFHSSSKECPVCKSSVSDTSSVIPLYGRGTLGSVDPRRKQQPIPDDLHVPHRPSARLHDNHSNDWEILPDDAAQIGEDGFGNADLPSEFGLSQPMFSYGFPHNNNIAAARSGYYGAASGGRMPGRISSYEPDWRSNEQRDVLFYRLYLLIVCVVIVFVLFF